MPPGKTGILQMYADAPRPNGDFCKGVRGRQTSSHRPKTSGPTRPFLQPTGMLLCATSCQNWSVKKKRPLSVAMWHTTNGMLTGFVGDTDLVCFHLDRYDKRGTRILKRHWTLQWEEDVLIPFFADDLCLELCAFTPVSLVTHKGDESGGHYQSYLLVNAGRDVVWFQTDDGMEAQPVQTSIQHPDIAANITMIWLCRKEKLDLHRPLDHPGHWHMVYKKLQACYPDTTPHDPVRTVAKVEVEPPAPARHSEAAAASEAPSTSAFLGMFPKMSLSNSPTKEAWMEFSFFSLEGLCIGNNFNVACRFPLGEIGVFAWEDLQYKPMPPGKTGILQMYADAPRPNGDYCKGVRGRQTSSHRPKPSGPTRPFLQPTGMLLCATSCQNWSVKKKRPLSVAMWHTTNGMLTGFVGDTDLVCFHLDRYDKRGTRIMKRHWTLQWEEDVLIPFFADDLCLELCAFTPVSLVTHKGDESGGHYQSYLLVNAGRDVVWFQTDDGMEAQPVQTSIQHPDIAANITMIWLCRKEKLDLHRPLDHPGHWHMVYKKLQACYPDTTPHDPVRTVAKVEVEPPAPARHSEAAAASEAPSTSTFLGMFPKMSLSNSPTKEAWMEFSFFSLEGLCIGNNFNVACRFPLGEIGVFAWDDLQYKPMPPGKTGILQMYADAPRPNGDFCKGVRGRQTSSHRPKPSGPTRPFLQPTGMLLCATSCQNWSVKKKKRPLSVSADGNLDKQLMV